MSRPALLDCAATQAPAPDERTCAHGRQNLQQKPLTRRALLRSAAVAPLALAAVPVGAERTARLAAPRFTLSANLELMFPKSMPHAQRIGRIAAQGMKAFSFWGIEGKDSGAMLAAQKRTGLLCGSIAGTMKTGTKTGLTKPGFEQAYLDDVAHGCEVANRFGAQNVICFVGTVQQDVPWKKQYQQIIRGLRKAGDVAEKHDVFITLEPLNPLEMPHVSVHTATEGFQIIAEVDHPRVKLDFDIYHLQLSEGNLINNLKLGLGKGWIRYVEIGDVPGRNEPGTGEINYANIFRTLRELDYSGFVGMEHGTSSTPEHAMQVVQKLAGVT